MSSILHIADTFETFWKCVYVVFRLIHFLSKSKNTEKVDEQMETSRRGEAEWISADWSGRRAWGVAARSERWDSQHSHATVWKCCICRLWILSGESWRTVRLQAAPSELHRCKTHHCCRKLTVQIHWEKKDNYYFILSSSLRQNQSLRSLAMRGLYLRGIVCRDEDVILWEQFITQNKSLNTSESDSLLLYYLKCKHLFIYFTFFVLLTDCN